MKTLILAVATLVSATGFAAAESNQLFGGNYSANVLVQYDTGIDATARQAGIVDRFTTASVTAPSTDHENYSANISLQDRVGR